MISFFDIFGKWLKTIFNSIAPVIIFLFTLSILIGLLKWTNKTKENIKDVGRNPILLVIWLIISIVMIVLFYKYVIPLINNYI